MSADEIRESAASAPTTHQVQRVEVESLMPGDVFEYFHERLNRMVRDRVVQMPDDFWITALRGKHMQTGNKFFKYMGREATEVRTEVGENNHGYVILPARTVVLRISPAQSPSGGVA